MNYFKQSLSDFENVFSKYTDSFLRGQPEFDRNILLKTEHSLLVQQECRYLAEAENFSPRLAMLAEIAGLFHDIGRFEQLRRFNTFVDCNSIDHGELGGKVLTTTQMLDILPEEDFDIVLEVTRYHNKRLLPDNISGDVATVLKAVRDADKLDIMRVLLTEYAKGELDETVILHLEKADTISPPVLEHLQKGENPNIGEFKTLTDFKMAQLAWIYDLNFSHSLREFKKRNFYEQVMGYLPKTEQIRELCEKMLAYLDKGEIRKS